MLGTVKQVFKSIKDAPNYPRGFVSKQGGITRNTIKDSKVLAVLREIESGTWTKVYKDRYDASGKKVSIHYFESKSGKVFDVKVKKGWSNG